MERIVWGTDWPHVMVKHDMPHDADLLNAAGEWLPAKEQQNALFADNAANLYGWP
jgi:predicted TIM-barrel fold metal-dependent hydrolase